MRPATVPIIVAALAALILPAPVLAARSVDETTSQLQLMCPDLVSDAGRASVDGFIGADGSGAGFAYWAPGAEPEGSPTWHGSSTSITLETDPATLDITFLVYAPGEVPSTDEGTEDVPGEPGSEELVGEATLSAILSPDGEPHTWQYRDRYGNQHVSGEGSVQWLAVAGTLTLPLDRSFDLGSCAAMLEESRYRSNNPEHAVSQFSGQRLTCAWSMEDGDVWFFATDERYGTWAEVWVQTGSAWYMANGIPDMTRTTVAFDGPLYVETWDGEPQAVGSVAADAVLAEGERFKEVSSWDGTRSMATGTRFATAGSLELDMPGGHRSLAMDDTICEAAIYQVKDVPAPTPPAQPLPNDGPEAALPIAMDEIVTVETGGTTLEREYPCLALDPESGETHELPITNTAWWSFAGTGGSLTLDTAGSSFDTIVGVYLVEDGAVGTALGCVDDVPDGLQARMTIETEAGATYLVQAGGYGGSTGTLTLELRQP